MRYEFQLPGGANLVVTTENAPSTAVFPDPIPVPYAPAVEPSVGSEQVVYFALPGSIADRLDKNTVLAGMEWRERRRGKGKQVVITATPNKAKQLMEQLRRMEKAADVPDYIRHTARETIAQVQKQLRKQAA
jgi:hypothetical protein